MIIKQTPFQLMKRGERVAVDIKIKHANYKKQYVPD